MDADFIARNPYFSKIDSKMELFLQKLREGRFHTQKFPTNPSKMPLDSIERGWELIENNYLLGFTLRDCSFLHITPKIIARPRSITQLQIIVKTAHNLQIPLTFASGKTGLSGGFANPFILIDLEFLSTLPKPYTFNQNKNTILADQSVLVSELIRIVQIQTDKKYIFPCQPSSAFKLPVRVGGLIGTNASGITAGKLGPIKNWVENMLVILPTGEIKELTKNEKLFNQIIGGMGLYGVVLNARIRLAPNPEPKEMTHYILYGPDFSFIFDALQEIQQQQIFPLNSEFISGTVSIPGIFQDLSPSSVVKWIILIKDEQSITARFINIVEKFGICGTKSLNPHQYQLYLEERTGLAIQTKSNDPEQEFIRFPGFEDLLMPPVRLKEVLEEINIQFQKFQFPPLIVAYGHLNFRRGQGLLLHIRIPVNVSNLASDPPSMYRKIAKITAKMNFLLEQKYHIRPKAEHSTGMFTFWHARHNLSKFYALIREGRMFFSPHLYIFHRICVEIGINLEKPFPDEKAEELLEKITFIYLTNKFSD